MTGAANGSSVLSPNDAESADGTGATTMTTTTAFDALSTLCTLAALTAFSKETTVSVYSGKDGKCCCGCAGTHRYNSRLVATASANRGYEVSADEINDAQVTRVLRTIAEGAAGGLEFGNRYVARSVNGRLFIAYLASGIG